MGSDAPAGPNRVANDWLKLHVGRLVRIVVGEETDITGRLIRWDSYALLLEVNGKEALVLKAPGMRFYEAKGDSSGQ